MVKRWKPALLISSLALNALCVALALILIHQKGGLPWLERKAAEVFSSSSGGGENLSGDYSSTRISVFDELPIGASDIVFIGDSIFDFGEWHEMLDDPRVKNRSIAGDDTASVLKRLDQIAEGKPAHVVLLLGINNVQQQIAFEQTTTEYSRIVAKLLSKSAETQIWLLPVFPVHPRLYRMWITPGRPDIYMPKQPDVESLNRFIQHLSTTNPSRVHYVPVPSILSPFGHLGEDFTLDGLHLNGRGLSEVADAVTARIQASTTGD